VRNATRRTIITALAATAATGWAGSAAAAESRTPREHPRGYGGGEIEARADSLFPEGIAYDAERRAFLVSSVRQGTVSRVDRNGEVTTLVDDPELISTIGIHVDRRRGRLLVVNTDNGTGVRTSPATAGVTARLGEYDLDTGERLAYTDLAALTSGATGHFANDVTPAPDGTAYVTDSAAGIVYKVGRGGEASVLVEDDRLVYPGGFGANGIVHQNGRLIIGNYSDGSLWSLRVDRPASLEQVATDADMVGVDGLTLLSDGSLIAVTNTMGGSGSDAVTRLRLSRDWSRADVVGRELWPEPATTAAVRGREVWAVSGDVGALLSGSTESDGFTLRRF